MVPDTYTLSDARVFVEHIVPAGWESGTELTWALREEQDGGRLSLIGMLGARGCPGGVWEIGYWLAPEARRQAAATRAGHALVGAAFEAEGPMRASTLRWRCRVPNWDSWRVAWKLGFRRDEPAAPTGPGTAGAGGDEWSGTLLPGDSRGPAAPWDGPCSPRA